MGHLALQVSLKGRAPDHQLIDQMVDLQALTIILRRPPSDPCIPVSQGIELFEPHRQAREDLALAILFVILVCGSDDPFRSQ